jgi:Tfp pilus assembly protein PilE
VYRQSSYDARAKSDLRNAATAEEAYFATEGAYVSCTDAQCTTELPDFRLSATVSIEMTADNSASPTFTGTASSSKGTKTFSYDSNLGGMLN